MDFDKYTYHSKVSGGRLVKDNASLPPECAPHIDGDICSRPKEITKMRKFLAKIVPELSNEDIKTLTDKEVINQIKSSLDLDHESEIYSSETFRHFIGHKVSDAVLKFRFKPEGPWQSTDLLDNFNIDETLEQWAKHSQKQFNKKFYHVHFQMIDFNKVKSELAVLDVPDLIRSGYDCMGVVLNTDVSSGRGKHWFCIYCDFQHKGTEKDPYKLEFFNSSGNPPVSEVYHWLNTTKHSILRDLKKRAEIVIAATEQLQHSNTECGVWSLMYTFYRLNGNPASTFVEKGATDTDMYVFRKHLFRRNTG